LLVCATNVVFAQEESVSSLFEKALDADPADYGAIRTEIVGRGAEALHFLEERRAEASNWYERALAGALVLGVGSPKEYEEYQKEFDKWSNGRRPPSWGKPAIEHDYNLIREGEKAVPFLVEKLLKEVPHEVRDSTVLGRHTSHPVETATAFLTAIGGGTATRAVAAIVIYAEDIYDDPGYHSYWWFVESKRSGRQIYRLSKLPDTELVDQMIELIKQGSFGHLPGWLLGGLGEIAVPALTETMLRGKGETQRKAALALAWTGPAGMASLGRVFEEGPVSLHKDAVYALVVAEDRRAVRALIKALDSPDASVVGSAAAALGRLGDPAAIEPLLRALNEPRNWDTSASAIRGIARALAEFEEPRAFDRLAKLAKHEGLYVRRAAIKALPDVGGEKSLPILLELIKHEHEATRGDAARALGELGDRRAVTALIDALNDTDHMVRSGAAHSLGQIGDSQAIEPLRKMIEKSQRRVHEHESLARVAGAAIRKIEEVSASGDK
jgi:HEAT repeat protein